MNKTRTVIFGGSFDPIHNGHLALAAEVLERGVAAEVWFMVTPQNPHKQDVQLSNEQERILDVIQGEEDKTQDKIKDAKRGTIVYGKKNW